MYFYSEKPQAPLSIETNPSPCTLKGEVCMEEGGSVPASSGEQERPVPGRTADRDRESPLLGLLTLTGHGGYLCGMHGRGGTERAFRASQTKILLGSGHSSSIPYPMSLCCWDKVLFVWPWLLAGAHSALIAFERWDFHVYPFFSCSVHPSLPH